MINYKRKATLHLKNIIGRKVNKRIVIFSFDDFGNVFLNSKKAKDKLVKDGINVENSRFSKFDILEHKDDLSHLYDTLTSFKDTNSNHPIITAFSTPANIDFDKVLTAGNQQYHYETLPETFQKLPGYEGTWDLWTEGIKNKLLFPQFHGREHLNVHLFNKLLVCKNKVFLTNLENRSYAVIHNPFDKRVGFTEAFSFKEYSEIESHKKIIEDGTNLFKKVFGELPLHFNAPGAREHKILEKTIAEQGMVLMDTDILKKEHQGEGMVKNRYHYLGQKNEYGQTYIYRNCVFEPLLNSDCVDDCLNEMEIAFTHNKPANISSHRVNFVGGIDVKVRELGMSKFKELIRRMMKKWPDIEFKTTVDLINIWSK